MPASKKAKLPRSSFARYNATSARLSMSAPDIPGSDSAIPILTPMTMLWPWIS